LITDFKWCANTQELTDVERLLVDVFGGNDQTTTRIDGMQFIFGTGFVELEKREIQVPRYL